MLEELKKEFEVIYNDCVKGDKNENDVQRFMEANTQLIPRIFLSNHGIHLGTVFLKVLIGNGAYKSDFMLITKSTADWTCVHIEIENPASKPFTKSGELSSAFSHAISQVNSWRSLLTRPEQQIAFKERIKKSLLCHMSDNPIGHKFVLVFGRREDLTQDKMELWRSLSNDSFHVMTFDSLFEDDSKANDTLHLGTFMGDGTVQIRQMNGIFDCGVFGDMLKPHDFMFRKDDIKKMIDDREARFAAKSDFVKKVEEPFKNRIIENLKKIPTID